MNDLQLRKQTLVLESELNRLALREECLKLRAAVERLQQPGANVKWLLLLAPVAGFLATRLFRRRESSGNLLGSALKWLPVLLSLWRGFKSRFAKPSPPAE